MLSFKKKEGVSSEILFLFLLSIFFADDKRRRSSFDAAKR